MIKTRYIIVLAVIAAAAVGVGYAAAVQPAVAEQPVAFDRAATAKDIMPTAARPKAFAVGETRRIASFGNAPRAVFVATTTDAKMLCFWDVDLLRNERGGGCSERASFFNDRHLAASLMFNGGPALDSVTSARIVGLVTARVGRVEIVNSDGSSNQVTLTRDRGFAYEVPAAQLAAGVEPVAVVAYDRAGRELTRQPTGITH